MSSVSAEPPKAAPAHTHADASSHADCAACLVPLPNNRSSKIAWTVAGVAVALLVIVFFLGVGSRPSTLLAGGGLGLAVLLICPLTMGGMMWFMSRKH